MHSVNEFIQGAQRVTDSMTDNSTRAARRRAARPATGIAAWPLWQRITLFATAGVVVVLALGTLADLGMSAGKVHPGVTVGGVEVGGLSPDKAASALEKQLTAKSKEPVTLTYKDKTWPIKPADLALTFDYASLVDSAMSVGRSPSIGTSTLQRMAAWVGKADLAAPVKVDAKKLDKVLGVVASDVDAAPRDASVSIEGTEVKVLPSANGVAVNRPKVSARLLAAFIASDRRVPVETVTASVRVTDAAAQEAKATVETMLAKPVTVTLDKKSWEFSAKEIARLIAFRTVESSASATSAVQTASATSSDAKWTLEVFVSAAEASRTVPAKLGAGIGRPAVDAKFKTTNGKVIIIPSQDGIGPDIDTLATDLTRALTRDPAQERVVVLTTRTAQPKRTTAMARDMGIVERISTYTTTYSSGAQSRVNNIHTLGDALDGKLIGPGQTFSFNGYVGERTASKGYQEAPAIVNGKLVPQLGGGICQVGTTLFNAIFLSGLPVKERHNHSFYISHYPKGRDATVSWGGPDIKFVNETKSWVMISVSYSSSSITISLYGTDPGYEVTSKTGPFTNEKPFRTETIKDPKLASGMKVIMDNGVKGRTCVVTRTVSKGGAVVRTDNFKSVYRPKAQVVRVGSKPVAGSGTSSNN